MKNCSIPEPPPPPFRAFEVAEGFGGHLGLWILGLLGLQDPVSEFGLGGGGGGI